jgi:hypothetical protein
MKIKRREFISLLGGAAAAWPVMARAQQTYRLGILSGRSRDEPNFVAFFEELRQVGIVEGQQLPSIRAGSAPERTVIQRWRWSSLRREPMLSWPQAMRR